MKTARSWRAAGGAAVTAGLSLWLAGCSLTAPRGSDGYADFGEAGGFGQAPAMVISIGPALLDFTAGHIDDDPDLARLFQALDGVVIRIYEIEGNGERVAGRMARMNSALVAEGWQQVLLLRERGEAMHLLVKLRGKTIRGLALLASDGEEEAVAINLMGDIPPARFNDVMAALDMDLPGGKGVRVAGVVN